MRWTFILILAGFFLGGLGGSARADAIDGDWCHADGRRFSINGPNFVTPGGNRIQGDYGYYSFAYRIPKSEAGAGLGVSMVFIDDDTLHVTLGKGAAGSEKGVSPGGPLEVWHRCRGGIT
jgi:hypothetical protein